MGGLYQTTLSDILEDFHHHIPLPYPVFRYYRLSVDVYHFHRCPNYSHLNRLGLFYLILWRVGSGNILVVTEGELCKSR